MSEGDVAFACARVFVDGLVGSGMEHACVSPGSRSTPIALALARDDRVRVHVHLDERSSAFFALGLAKASSRPVAVVCTSGTAAANLLPAIVEASMARVPLVALTADRPPELRGVGANQTIEQRGLFGRYVRWEVEAPLPSVGPDADTVWWLLAAEAHDHACAPTPGPVHVNLPFREPLVPSGEPAEIERSSSLAIGQTALSFGPPPAPADVDALVALIDGAGQGLVYAGGLRAPAPAAVELGRGLGWPVLAEPTSGVRVPGSLSAGAYLLADGAFAAAHVPEVMVQVGAAPTSRPALAVAEAAQRLVIVDPDDLVADPHRRAERRFVANAEELLRAAAARVGEREVGGWADEWLAVDGLARRTVDDLLDGWDEPSEARAARDLSASLPDGATLVVGSSMPVRDLDEVMVPRGGLRVLANRGASGIDGFVSTALGVAAAGGPTAALCGDLTLLHDAGALLWNAGRGNDLVLVVLNNGGGVIFSFLAQRELPELENLFTTPHGLDLAALCSAAGAGHRRIERADELVPAVERAREAGGVRVVEVPIDPERNVRRHAEVRAAVAEALRSGR